MCWVPTRTRNKRSSRQGRSPADGRRNSQGQGTGDRGHGSTLLHTRRGRGGPAGATPASLPARPVTSRPPGGAGSIELRREGLDSILPQQASGSLPDQDKSLSLSLSACLAPPLAHPHVRPRRVFSTIVSIDVDRSAVHVIAGLNSA